jgi:hypothetical protein
MAIKMVVHRNIFDLDCFIHSSMYHVDLIHILYFESFNDDV